MKIRPLVVAALIGVATIATACVPPNGLECKPPAYPVGEACLIPPVSTTP